MALVRHNLPWSDEEIRRMLDMFDRGMSKAAIGERLGRTKYAVTFRLSRIKRCRSCSTGTRRRAARPNTAAIARSSTGSSTACRIRSGVDAGPDATIDNLIQETR